MSEAFNRAAPVDVRAAYFLYLNKFCFNGLSRYSVKGNFNVPWGRSAQAPALPEKNIRAFSERARSKAVIVHGEFTDAFKLAVPDDVIYCDQPYVDLADAPSFTKYAVEGFLQERQEKLADLAHAGTWDLSLAFVMVGAVAVMRNRATGYWTSVRDAATGPGAYLRAGFGGQRVGKLSCPICFPAPDIAWNLRVLEPLSCRAVYWSQGFFHHRASFQTRYFFCQNLLV